MDALTIEADPREVDAVDNLLPPAKEIALMAETPIVTQPSAQDDMAALIAADPSLAAAVAFARIPGINEGMFDRLMAFQTQEKALQAEERFNEAMAAAQSEIEPVARTAENSQTKSWYAKLEAVDAAIRPIYLRHGFNVAYNTVPPLTPGNIRVECEVSLGRHSKKYWREAPADTLGPKGTAVKTVLHGGGSTETFLKRYAVTGAFNVVFKTLVDDDGVRGGQTFIEFDQIQQLRDLIGQTKRTEAKFIRTMISRIDGSSAESFNDVEVKDFPRVLNTLKVIVQQEAVKQE